MKNERFLGDLPDTVPPPGDGEEEATPEFLAAYNRLRLKVDGVQRRRQGVFDKFGFVLDPSQMESVRLAILVKHGLGQLTSQRINFEMEWLEVLETSIENGLAEMQKMKKSKDLILPGGVHKDPPKENGK